MIRANSGHRSKSMVEKPVVVIMDAVWNAEWCRLYKNDPEIEVKFTAIAKVETNQIIKYHLTSSIEKASFSL